MDVYIYMKIQLYIQDTPSDRRLHAVRLHPYNSIQLHYTTKHPVTYP